MSLHDKLNEQRQKKSGNETELIRLLEETKELNDLMRSYIRFHTDKEGATALAFQHEIEQMQELTKATDKMLDGRIQGLDRANRHYGNQLLEHMQTYEKKMAETNEKVIQRLENLERSVASPIEDAVHKHLNETEKVRNETKKLALSARKDLMLNDWIDAVKYGLTSGVVASVILGGFYFIVL